MNWNKVGGEIVIMFDEMLNYDFCDKISKLLTQCPVFLPVIVNYHYYETPSLL